MNTLFFKYAIEVDRTRSITQAAENLFMAQPNLSKAIKETEEMLGYEIFARTSKGVAPTEKGAEFLKYARNIMKQLDLIESIGDVPSDESTQSLSVSMPRGSYISKALVDLAAALDKTERIEMNVTETGSVNTINNIVDGKFNLGIIRYQTAYGKYFEDYMSEKHIKGETIWKFEHLALMSKDHKYANKEIITADDLNDSIEIIHGDNMIPYLVPEKELFKKYSSVKKKIYLYERANQFELLSGVPETFMWVSPVPQQTLDRYGLVQRKCGSSGDTYKDVLIYSDGHDFTKIEKLFIDKVYASKTELALKEYK